MNGEPLYDSSMQRWRPPSPKTTPQSTKFAFYPYDPSSVLGHSPEQAYGWVNSQTPLATPNDRTYGTPINNPSSASRVQSHNTVYQGTSFVQTLPSQCNQPEFPSGSFVEHFNSASLEDPLADSGAMTSSTPAAGMRTPPPTRDDSNRRKAYQSRLIEFQTPSTIASRRMSVPNESWHGQGEENTFTAPSPFTFTPLQFSPPGQFGFTPSGPMTAPVYPQSSAFWEPNSNHNMNQVSFSTIAEEPYNQSFPVNVGNTPSQLVFANTTSSSHRNTASESIRPPTVAHQSLPRPQSAHLVESRAGPNNDTGSFVSSITSVDPNMLWNTNALDSLYFPVDNSTPSKSAPAEEKPAYQPYQHQLESLKREKEESLKKSRGSFSSHAAEMPSQSAQSGLHRSMTDSKLRRGVFPRSASSSQGGVSTDDTNHLLPSQTVHIHRESSPLKRHRSNSQADQMTPTKTRARRSVVLTVDEQGNARTEIKQLGEESAYAPVFNATRSQDGFSDSSDISDSVSRLPLTISSSEASPGPNDAQNAIREVVRNRRMSRRSDVIRQSPQQGSDGYIMQDSMSLQTRRNAGSSNSNNSPTTITDPEFHTPTADRTAEPSGTTRCICEGRAPEDRLNLMIECESCKHWLHVACLGMTPDQIPKVFVCVFCTGSTPATRGGRVRTYSSNSFPRFGQ